MFEGNGDNPGSYDEKLSHCAAACLQKKPPKSGKWDGFAAEGFVMQGTGRCYCQSAESKSCKRDTRYHYNRFDFNSELCAKEKSGQCQNMLQHQFVLNDENISVSDDCKKVSLHFGIPIMMRDTFRAGAVYPNPELVTVDHNCALETAEAGKYAECKVREGLASKAVAKEVACVSGWLAPCGTYATGAALGDAKIWGGKGRSVKWWTDHCVNKHCGRKPHKKHCTKTKVAGKKPNYWCDKKNSMPKKDRSVLSVKPTISTVVRLDIDVNLATRQNTIKDRKVTLLSDCQVEGAGKNRNILENKCDEEMNRLTPILKKKIESAIPI